MRRVMVRYKVKAERAAENENYITQVFAALAKATPAGLRYASFKLADGVSFVHIASLERPDASNPLTELPAFQTFIAEIRDRCEEPPVTTDLIEVGSYRFFGE